MRRRPLGLPRLSRWGGSPRRLRFVEASGVQKFAQVPTTPDTGEKRVGQADVGCARYGGNKF